MTPRIHTARILELLRRYPAVALLGPRQCGKTTLAKSLNGAYFDLEKESDRLRLDVTWDAVVAGRGLTVFDEAQEMPELFPRLRAAIDEDRARTGRFLLLGSIAPALMTNVSESLAGRLGLCELTPFLASEINPGHWPKLWHFGGHPDGGILEDTRFPEWQDFYLRLLAQRDLPHWGLPASPETTLRLFRMLAACHGQVWNASQIGKSLGLSYHTVNRYVEFLQSAYLVRLLPAWSTNIGKRLVKSPKVYWRDSGLLHALLGVPAGSDLLEKPWVGASWEGWLIEQLCSTAAVRRGHVDAFFLRTSDQHEIDLLLQRDGRLLAFEMKLTAVPSHDDFRLLGKRAAMVGAEAWYLVCNVKTPVVGTQGGIVNMETCIQLFKD